MVKMVNNIYVVSDTHFNHNTMIREGWRQFKDTNSMNEYIISQWNKTVGIGDTVYHLGDVTMTQKKDCVDTILPRLNGNIIFIKGNHDSNSIAHIESCIINFLGYQIELLHNPMNISGDVKFVIHGHIHKSGHNELAGTEQIKPYLHKNNVFVFYNVNVEYHKYKPVLLNEILGELKNGKRKENI